MLMSSTSDTVLSTNRTDRTIGCKRAPPHSSQICSRMKLSKKSCRPVFLVRSYQRAKIGMNPSHGSIRSVRDS